MEVQLLMLVGILLPISTIGIPKQTTGPLIPQAAGQVAPGVFGNPYGQYYSMLLNYYRGLQNRGFLHANRQQAGNPFLLNRNLALNGLRTQQQVSNLAHVGYNIFQKKKDDYKYPTTDKYHNDKYPGDYYPEQKYPDGKYEYGPDRYPGGDNYKKNDKYHEKYDTVYPPGHHDKYPGDYYPGEKYPDGHYPGLYGKDKYPTGDKYKNDKYPPKYDSIYPQNYHNDKYPGDYYPGEKYPDGKYTNQYPTGYGPDKYPTGDKYKKNDKYPQKYDSGYPHGPHNDKYSGDYYPGEKYPDRKYTEYYPKGHDKYPNNYDTIYPSGPHYDGHYDGHKYPKDYHNDKYNDKYPNDYQYKGHNDRYPKDYHNDKYNDKYSKDPHYPGSDRHIRPNYLRRSSDPAFEFGLPVSNLRGGIRGGQRGDVLHGGSGLLGGRSGLGGNHYLFSNDIPEPVHSAATLGGGLLDVGPIGAGRRIGAGGRRLGGRHHYPGHTDKYPDLKDYKYDTYPKKDYHNPGGKYGPDHYKGPSHKKDYKNDKHGGHYKNAKSKKTY